jgi:hypothetical protein
MTTLVSGSNRPFGCSLNRVIDLEPVLADTEYMSDVNLLALLLEDAGLEAEAFAVKLNNLSRARASELSVDFCRRGHGRLATLLSRYAHPLPA